MLDNPKNPKHALISSHDRRGISIEPDLTPNALHVREIRKGTAYWNDWRDQNPEVEPDLKGSNLRNASLQGANLQHADLRGADLSEANLQHANLTAAKLFGINLLGANLKNANLTDANVTRADAKKADFSGANLMDAVFMHANLQEASFKESYLRGVNFSFTILEEANLRKACLKGADLEGACLLRADLSEVNLIGANFFGTELEGANLTQADLSMARLVQSSFEHAILDGCRIYGISAWELKLKDAVQTNLIITDAEEKSTITVDDLEVAQFMYLFLRNEKIRNVIDTITSKVVLILGNFRPTRKHVLDCIRDLLRHRGYIPVLFDWDKPDNQDVNETIKTLALLARFVIADLTEVKSVPHELQLIVPEVWKPVIPIIQSNDVPYGMVGGLKKYQWLAEPKVYDDLDDLQDSFDDMIINPATIMGENIRKNKGW